MPSCYVAGPMTSKPWFNFPAFDAAKYRLQFQNWQVTSPADLDRNAGFDPTRLPHDWDWNKVPDDFDLDAAMARDLAALEKCEAIVLLPGWADSKGAVTELRHAVKHGLKVLRFDGFQAVAIDGCEYEWLLGNRFANVKDAVAFRPVQLPPIPSEDFTNPVRICETKPLENPKDIAGSVKPALALIPHGPECQIANVMSYGAFQKGYGAWNWREKRPTVSAYLSAARRHLGAYGDGEDADPESGLSHLAHAAATLLIIMDAIEHETAMDDRPGRYPAA